MRIKDELKYYIEALVRLFYPGYCEVCGRVLHLDEYGVCNVCVSKLQLLREPLCLYCGRELAPYKKTKICASCRRSKRFFDRLWVLVAYEGVAQKILQEIKFRKKRGLLRSLRPIIAKRAGELKKSHFDVVLPVPLDKKRSRSREFNQSELLAKELGNLLEKPVTKRILFKKKHSMPQSQLSREERRRNVADVFGLSNKHLIQDKDILLVDDIITTGSTVNECAKVLKNNGAKRVHVFAIARTA